jgi:hypothetical protein
LSDKILTTTTIFAWTTRAIVHQQVACDARKTKITVARKTIAKRIAKAAQARTRLTWIEYEFTIGASIARQT